MPESYSVPEAVHHVEETHHRILDGGDARLRFVPLVAAILAVCAGLSSLLAGRFGAHVLSLKNEALLHEVTAADTWSQYQAESLKAHLYEISADTAPAAMVPSLRAQARKYRAEQDPLSRQARNEQVWRDQALGQSTALEIRKSNLEGALALFEVAIVLASVAAMIKRPAFFLLGGALGLIGLFFGLRGAFGLP